MTTQDPSSVRAALDASVHAPVHASVHSAVRKLISAWLVATVGLATSLPSGAHAAIKRPPVGGTGGGVIVTTPPKPPAPAVGVTERLATSLALRFVDSSSIEQGYQLQRRTDTSGFQNVANFGPQSGEFTFVDNGLTPDTRYCYRMRSFNENGSNYSSERCPYTKDGRDYRAWRAQLVVHTANVSDADTDDTLWVKLNGSNSADIPAGNHTYLDYGRDDFERGDVFAYDLNLDGIDTIDDITQISLNKDGDDGVCVADIALKVNGIEVFTKDFSSMPAGCHWMDNDSGNTRQLFVGLGELRAHPAWSFYNHQAALLILATFGVPALEMTSRIESMVGHKIQGEPLHWGHIHGPAVEITRGCPANEDPCTVAHVDLDLAKDSWLPDPEVDVDFDLDFFCDENGLTVTTTNLNVGADSAWYLEFLSLGLIELYDMEIADRVAAGWEALSETLDVGAQCSVNVLPNGDLAIEAIAGPAPPGNGGNWGGNWGGTKVDLSNGTLSPATTTPTSSPSTSGVFTTKFGTGAKAFSTQ